MTASLPDLVYIVRPGDDNEELRHSLRSADAHLPHGKVWVAGHVPPWLKNVEAIKLDPLPRKFANMRQSLRAALEQPGLSETFVLMNDDFFIMHPLTYPIPALHVGPCAEYLDFAEVAGYPVHDSPWIDAIRLALRTYGGSPYCYETHTPLHFDTAKLRELMDKWPADEWFNAPAVYHLAHAGSLGMRGVNTKIGMEPAFSDEDCYLSTNDDSFARGAVGVYIRERFPTPSRYEA